MITITIDWPAWSGKGTTARLLAEKLGFQVIDTGAIYRAVGAYLTEKWANIDAVNDQDLEKIGAEYRPEEGVFINGKDYTPFIRTPEAGLVASRIWTQLNVRNIVNETARIVLKSNNSVIEWRDMWVVFGDLEPIKIFLTADPVVRAHRRWLELQTKWDMTSEEEILSQILERDHRDMTREISPLFKSPDAIEIDTTHLTIPEQVEKIYEIVQSKLSIYNLQSTNEEF